MRGAFPFGGPPFEDNVNPKEEKRRAMKIDVQVVNAFIEGGKGGNPAGVVLDADHLTASQKQRIAAGVGCPKRPLFHLRPRRTSSSIFTRRRARLPIAAMPRLRFSVICSS
jgi:hypothetical protein